MPRKIGSLTLYSVDDLHEMLGVSKMTLRAYLREGRLKGRKLGVQWYVTEESIRSYFDESGPENVQAKKAQSDKEIMYVVQGVNDLVSETEICTSVEETLECLKNQAIISLFQVEIKDADNGEVIEIVKARDFLERYSG
ncbi:helix-turn-helix domain-containing protein [Rhodohalobacter mucosus]|uniref:DNA-binding protein n=1 Tax=Rhodohalobacter mucosus TaxID=2079485 RepID=A0A316TUA6_9BACT|nr:helix-turn-helix domain-containing protein [Rhodohalobacter mucosus]PWN05904.1 DNA-binding protein [Rhodohalobacter mucosus]